MGQWIGPLFCLLSTVINFAVAEEQVAMAALAKVGSQVVTTRDLQINQFLNEIEDPLREYMDKKEPLKELVWEHLILLESLTLLNQDVSAGEIASYIKKFNNKNQSDPLWKSLRVTLQELQLNAKRKITIRRMLNLKMSKDLILVSDKEIESYYIQNKLQLGQKPLNEVSDKISKGLKASKSQDRFKDWMSAVSRNHGVYYYSGFKIQ